MVTTIINDREGLRNLGHSIHTIIRPGAHKEIVRLIQGILKK